MEVRGHELGEIPHRQEDYIHQCICFVEGSALVASAGPCMLAIPRSQESLLRLERQRVYQRFCIRSILFGGRRTVLVAPCFPTVGLALVYSGCFTDQGPMGLPKLNIEEAERCELASSRSRGGPGLRSRAVSFTPWSA